jgi:alkylation response protein AidB-like acyl-CoA dehydrogenase
MISSGASGNPLVDDRDVELILDEVLDLGSLLRLPYFADHDRDTCQMLLESARDLARDVLLPSYRPTDADPPRLVDGKVVVHPQMRELYARLNDLGLVAAARPHAVGGSQVPLAVYSMASAYLMAGNLSAYGYLGLTQGAAHLLEVFGDDALKAAYMAKMYSGEWTGTMALTEPQAGSSLADITTTAEPTDAGHYLMRGSKIFISGGDQDITGNIVHMALGRLRGAPAGMKGVSLFCVPKRRLEGGALVDNDVAVTGVIHKIGFRALPSVALSFGERGDCRGWLVGEPHQGIRYMFQMMNEARIMVGMNGVATASVAYHESLAYARTRTQGRPMAAKDPAAPAVAITAHPDVRRMLLRQKTIVEGGLVLLARVSSYSDVAHHGETAAARERAALLLDLLTPVAKSFPAERGYDANVLAVQIHGGYGYSSEYLPEAWLRDQKLNSIHEGTTQIQALDLLGRRAVARGGAALAAFGAEVGSAVTRARAAGVDAGWIASLERAVALVGSLTAELAGRALAGSADAMLIHATDYLDLFSTVVIAWQWLELAAIAHEALAGELPRGRASRDAGYYRAKLSAAQYWLRTELPRIDHLAALCRDGEDSYAKLDPDWL